MATEPRPLAGVLSLALSALSVVLLVALAVETWPSAPDAAADGGTPPVEAPVSPGHTPTLPRTPLPTTGQEAGEEGPATPPPERTPSTSSPARPTHQAAGPAAEGDSLLRRVRVVDIRPNVPGYDRDCSPGAGCVFGPEWNDATWAPAGHNGCDTRNDVLREDLHRLEIDPGTNGCVVRRGILHDPYTGRRIRFERGWDTSLAVQIDHVIPLAAAWDLGAARWPRARREAFSNDVKRELIAVDGDANMAKSDSTPAQWMPPNRGFHCGYALKYLRAAVYWDLAITLADRSALRSAVRRCP